MPRKAQLTIYRRPETKVFWIRFTYQGKRYRFSLDTDDATAANRQKARIGREIRDAVWQPPDRLKNNPPSISSDFCSLHSFCAFLLKHHRHARARKRPRSCQADFYALRKLWKIYKINDINEITPKEADYVITHCRRSLSVSTCNLVHRHLKAIWSVAVRWGYASSNPWMGIKLIKADSPASRVPLSEQSISNLLQIAEDHGRDIHLACALGFLAGMRKAEICFMRWEWVNFDEGLVELKNGFGLFLKSHQPRSIALLPPLHQILEKYRQPAGYILKPEKLTWNGIYRYDIRRPFSIVVAQAGLPDFTEHGMRHSYACMLARMNVPIATISKYLGHESVHTTEIYINYNPPLCDVRQLDWSVLLDDD